MYPAATLAGRGLPNQGYRTGDGAPGKRKDLVSELANSVDLAEERQKLEASEHLLDAVVCVVAGTDFAAGNVISPCVKNIDLVRREGWIWVRPQP